MPLLFFLSVFSFVGSPRQSDPNFIKAVRQILPRNFDTVATAQGDLNRDGLDDIVVVIQDTSKLRTWADYGTAFSEGAEQRTLIILFQNPSGRFRLAAKSKHIMLCRECGGIFGDPFQSIDISKGVLVVSHYAGSAWRWSRVRKFRLNDGKFGLIGRIDLGYHNVSYCDSLKQFGSYAMVDVNLVTGERYREKTVEDCSKLIQKRDRIKVKPLIDLEHYPADESEADWLE